jgi:hypothetical protein
VKRICFATTDRYGLDAVMLHRSMGLAFTRPGSPSLSAHCRHAPLATFCDAAFARPAVPCLPW